MPRIFLFLLLLCLPARAAVVNRYFSTSSAGAADGTSWANRAVLFTGGAWSTVITNFNFAGSDSLRCYIGPGTHTITVALASGLFANPPTVANPLTLQGCDSSGVALEPPDPDWTADMPVFDDSGFPVLATTTNVSTINLTNCGIRMLKFTASGRNGQLNASTLFNEWCTFYQSTANSSAAACATVTRMYNCYIEMSGSSYAYGLQALNGDSIDNVRIKGVTGSSGNRRGIEYAGTTQMAVMQRVCAFGHGGAGIASSSTNAGQSFTIASSVFANNGGSGIKMANTASQTNRHIIVKTMVTGNTSTGIDGQSAARCVVDQCRVRNNSTDITGLGNYPTDFSNTTSAGTDSAEYVDATNGDFRIKSSAGIANQGFGISQQASTGGESFSVSVGP